MPTVENLNKRLNDLDKDRGYFRLEDFLLADPRPGESLIDAIDREHPFKTINPAIVQSILLSDQ